MLCALGLTAGVAHAGLPAAISYEYFGLNYAGTIATSTAFGVLDYTGGPGCGGICTATTVLGADPGVSIQVDQVVYDGGGGGYTEAELGYYLEAPGSGATTLYLHAADSLVTAGGSEAQAYIAVGLASTLYASFNNFASYAYQDTDCANYCSRGVANYTAPEPLPADQAIPITKGELYFVVEDLIVGAATSGLQLTNSADPTFTAAPGVTILYSPGVTSGVPEPAAWMMVIAGLGAAGAAARTRRRRPVVSSL